MLDPTRRFSDRVRYYVQSRPKYPAALLQFCRDTLGLTPQHRIADIGSGTGFLSELFIHNGNVVFAVEPNAPMRAAAEASLGSFANLHSIDATAEATTLDSSSVDFVTAGQAFHWFDRGRSREEFRRILRPGGWVILVWNERKLEGDAFAKAYDQIVDEFQTELHRVKQNITATDSKTLTEFFAPAPYATATFPNAQSLGLEGLLARALSSSYLPLPGHPRCQAMLDRLQQIFSEHQKNGVVQQHYDTQIYYGQL